MRRPRGSAAAAGVFARLCDAYGIVLVALLVELVYVVVAARAELILGLEPGIAARTLIPIGALLGAPVAIALGAAIELAARSDRRPAARIALVVAAGVAGAVVGWSVGGGRQVEPYRGPFAALVALVCATAVAVIAPRIAAAARAAVDSGHGRRVSIAAIAIAIGIAILDRLALPRLYPGFHAAMLALMGLAAVAATLGADYRRSGARRAGAALAVFAIAAAIATRAPAILAPADNVRRVFYERGPALGRVVELATWLAPPPPVDAGEVPSDAAGAPVLDLRGRDVVIITIDALRADHVGAYGYERPTTPRIDALAKDGVVFERAYTATPHTSYAIGSLLTGKYLRPLLLQGLGQDSETFADHLRRYGFKTGGFYPPAVFFVDKEQMATFEGRDFGFEYVKKEFAPGPLRVEQVRAWLASVPAQQDVFLWVHLFEPHEPYEAHAGRDFGSRDVDRYDGEIAEADAAVGGIVDLMRARRPETVVVVTADHGEEFGDHGGYYHGTTVYEEQVRVPLVVSAPGMLAPRRVAAPVQLVDLLPTVLSGLHVPRPARIRGKDLGPWLRGTGDEVGFAFAETDAMGLCAEGSLRLVCLRRAGACSLFDVAADPQQTRDVGPRRAEEATRLRDRLRALDASHGKYEERGARAEGKGWPEALRRAIAGDGDSAVEAAALLDDADVEIRRRTAEALFDLRRTETISALRLALARDEDPKVQSFAALALTRLGQGTGRAVELLKSTDRAERRLAALALAEAGEDAGEDILIAWLRAAYPAKAGREAEPLSHERAREIVAALGVVKSKDALPVLLDALRDVRLRPFVAGALAAVGEEAARVPLAEALAVERYRNARIAIVEAMLKLGATYELRDPLVSFLGMPDPLPGGVEAAEKAEILQHVGGPREAELGRLRRFATSGVGVDVVIPKALHQQTAQPGQPGAAAKRGVRALCRARTTDGRAGEIRLGRRLKAPTAPEKKAPVPASTPELDSARSVVLAVPPGEAKSEPFASLPEAIGWKPGDAASMVVYATQNVAVDACVLVPERPELPPPPPEPWAPNP
jgi:arylsulfatase A-like enzyme/HEAT repeat protein